MLPCASHLAPSRERPLARRAALVPAAVLLAITGCASPGVPRPPSLHLPEPLTSLTARRQGTHVVLSFTTPANSTDGFPLKDPVRAALCRAVAKGVCRPTASFPAPVTVAGPVEWLDVLPRELSSGAPRQLLYKVQLFNAAGRTAGWSVPAFAASGEAPPTVKALHAEGSRSGIVLRWSADISGTGEVLLERKNLAPETTPALPRNGAVTARQPHNAHTAHGVAAVRGGKDSGGPNAANATLWLRASDQKNAGDSGGTIDRSVHADVPYRYTALRSRILTVDGVSLELRSDPSPAVEITLRDIYPPAVPQGLMAAEFPVEGSPAVSVDLVWQPGLENDLAGYDVFRQTIAATGLPLAAPEKLNQKLLALPAFRDTAASRGMHYRYSVTALDTKGNGSAPSAPVDVQTAP